MGYVIPPGFSRVTFEYLPVSPLGSSVVWGFGCSVPPTETLTDLLSVTWAAEIAPRTHIGYTLQRIVARNDLEVAETLVNTAGEDDLPGLTPQACALVQLTTGLTGRQNRGRIYMPGVLQEPDVDNQGTLATTGLSKVTNIMSEIADNLVFLDGFFVILHSSSSDPTPVTGLSVSTSVATQRRRMRA